LSCVVSGCVVFAEGIASPAVVRSKVRLPQTAAATAAPLVEAAALLAVSRNQAAQARSDVVEETVLEGEEFTTIVPENTTLKANFTGNPQIDYKFDPNLPRELNGLNLSDYPFYSLVPTNINFNCNGLTDGFYANVEHKCQV
jgi:zinc finger CCCH domain-containing protein 13